MILKQLIQSDWSMNEALGMLRPQIVGEILKQPTNTHRSKYTINMLTLQLIFRPNVKPTTFYPTPFPSKSIIILLWKDVIETTSESSRAVDRGLFSYNDVEELARYGTDKRTWPLTCRGHGGHGGTEAVFLNWSVWKKDENFVKFYRFLYGHVIWNDKTYLNLECGFLCLNVTKSRTMIIGCF